MGTLEIKRKEIENRINSINVSQFKHELMRNLKLNYTLNSLEKEDYQILGNTRLGGFPDLPKSYKYPTSDEGYYNLLIQLNFSEIEEKLEDFPDTGILYVFQGASNSDDFQILYITEIDNLEKKLPPKNVPNLNKENKTTCYDSYKAKFKVEHHFEGDIIWKIYDLNQSYYEFLTKTNSTYSTQLLSRPYGGLDAKKNAYLAIIGYEKLMYIPLVLYPRISESGFQDLEHALIIDFEEKINDTKLDTAYFTDKKQQLMEFSKNRIKHMNSYSKTICVLSIESLSELSWQWGDGGEINMYLLKDDLRNRRFQNCHMDISST